MSNEITLEATIAIVIETNVDFQGPPRDLLRLLSEKYGNKAREFFPPHMVTTSLPDGGRIVFTSRPRTRVGVLGNEDSVVEMLDEILIEATPST